MQAMVLTAPGELDLKAVAEPVAGDGQVVLDVSACAVCRTDLQIVRGDLPMRRSPLIPGHQVVGRLATGERVGLRGSVGPTGRASTVKPGSRTCVRPRSSPAGR